MVKLQELTVCFVNLKVGVSNPLLGNTSIPDIFPLHPCSCTVFRKTFYYQEMARIYPPNAQNSECQIFYFLTFSTERSKFLEKTWCRIVSHRELRRMVRLSTKCLGGRAGFRFSAIISLAFFGLLRLGE